LVLNSTRTTAIAVVLAAFVAGLVGGAAGDRIYLYRRHRLSPEMRGGMTKHVVARLDRELHFDSGQRTKVESILESRRKRIDSLWSSVRPQVVSEIDATNAEIEKVLKPEQIKAFKAIQVRMRNRRHGGGLPPPPPS
jgi:hypothetical protein